MTARDWMRWFEGIAEAAAHAAPSNSIRYGATAAAAAMRVVRQLMHDRGEQEAVRLIRDLAATPAPRVDLDAVDRDVFGQLGIEDGDGRDGGGD